ncbi:hypothetical protein ACFL3Q_13170 [Planctomycetota bacterium]
MTLFGFNVDRLQLDSAVAEQDAGGSSQVYLCDLISHESPDISQLCVAQGPCPAEHFGTCAPADKILRLFDLIVVFGGGQVLGRGQDSPPVLPQIIHCLAYFLSDPLRRQEHRSWPQLNKQKQKLIRSIGKHVVSMSQARS